MTARDSSIYVTLAYLYMLRVTCCHEFFYVDFFDLHQFSVSLSLRTGMGNGIGIGQYWILGVLLDIMLSLDNAYGYIHKSASNGSGF